MIQKLAQYFDRMIAVAAQNGMQPISAGVDIAYEAGRRIGVMQGMIQSKQALFDFNKQEEDKEKRDEPHTIKD